MQASIVIPNYNGIELLQKNLPLVIKALKYASNNILEVIIVDNDSTDASCDFIKNTYPEVRLIKHTVNRGFVAGVNTGARLSKGDVVILLNTDVLPEENFMVSVWPHFSNKRLFAVSLHEKSYGPAKGVFKDGFIGHMPEKEHNVSQQTFWVSGGSGVFRRDVWVKLGGMDERLFSPGYWEDIDLSYRALKRGYSLLWESKAKVVHEHESTASKFPKGHFDKIRERNQLLFIWKNLTSRSLFRKHVAGLLTRLAKHPGYIKIVLMALIRIKDVIRLGNKEKKETKVSDEAIFASFTN